MNGFDVMEPTEVREIESVMEIADSVTIPLDLTEWVGKAKLREWTLEHVDSYPWNSGELQALLKQQPNFEARRLFATLTLAYSSGLFGAEDILHACSQDAEFRPVRPTLLPRLPDFSGFRKLNLALLKASLVHVVTQALKSQFIEGETIDRLPPGLRRLVIENATERLSIARHMDRAGG
jgi:hypothetical protein